MRFLLGIVLTASLFVSAGFMSACSTTPTATAVTPREERDFKDVFNLFSKAAYESAIGRAQAFAKRYPKSSQLAQVENLQGLSYLATQHASLAVNLFKKAIQDNQDLGGNKELEPYLDYNLANAQFEANQLEESARTTLKIRMEDLDKENRVKATYLRARILAKQNKPAESAADALTVGKMLGTAQSENRSAISALLDQDLALIADPAVLEDLARAHEDSPLVDQVLFRAGSVELARGNRTVGIAHLNRLKTRFPDSPYYAKAQELMRGGDLGATPPGTPVAVAAGTPAPSQLRDSAPVNSLAIGVLLPTQGKFAKFGQRSLQGIELAFRIFNHHEPDSKVTLVIEDSGDDAESAVRGLERLVRRHHVVGVIGPLLSKGVDQVTQRAQELGVPLLSLSRHHGIAGDYIFQAGLTLRLQAHEMARYAIQQLGYKRFAILYPRDKVGEETAQKFWDAVEALGGNITGYESYNPGETDFRQPVDKLSGLYYTEARSKELEAMAKERELNKIKKRTRKTEQYFSLKPIVDYDAVFIPEEPKVTGQILPTFAYRDVDHVKFLGTSAWNTPELTSRAQGQVANAYFPDAFFMDSPSATARKYAERYRATFAQDPTAMDALAYDAAHLLESILSGHDGLSRAELRDRLREVKNFPGVTGKISYQDGHLSRDLKILTVKGDKIVAAGSKESD